MAGRQFSFFLAPRDQLSFENALRATGDIAFCLPRSQSPKLEECESTLITEFGEVSLRVIIARAVDLPTIKLREIKGRNEYSCDVIGQPIVEFDRSFVSLQSISAGRFYRIDKYWDDAGNLESKSPEFIEWAERLYKAAKKSLIKVEQGCYAGAEALELRKAGVAFEGLDIELGSVAG